MNEMNCKECAAWAQAYLDNELDTSASIRVRAHLDVCPDCAAQLKGLKQLREAVKAHVPYHEAPAALRQNIMAQLKAETQSVPWFAGWRQWFAPAFSTVALAVAAFLYVSMPGAMDQFTDEIVASHVRSLQEQHLTDVVSSDRHTVKPWFTGKIDYAPPVYDFTAQGFPLLGGRLDYIDHQTVAVLSYRHDKHIINLYVMPTGQGNSHMVNISKRGYNLLFWRQSHLAFEAISDLNSKELQMLGDLVMSPPK